LVAVFPGFFHVRTVGDIGTIPQSLPDIQLPGFNWSIIISLLPAALTIAALAAIESLLSAVVADGLTDTRHKPNKELMGQGLANIGSALFGGMPATGAIARTATNVRNGAKTRWAAVFHAIWILLFILIAAPLASRIPLAALAGILMFVAFNMVEWERIRLIFKTPLSDVAVMVVTFLLTIIVDLTVAIEVGLVLAALLFMKRMSDLYKVESLEAGKPDSSSADLRAFNHPDISIYTVQGPLFFGAASRFDQRVATMPGGHKKIKIIRMKHVPVIDATGINFLTSTFKKHRKIGGVVLFSSVHPDVMRIIRSAGIEEEIGKEHFCASTREAFVHALKHAHRMHGQDETVTKEELERYHLADIDAEDKQPVASTRDVDPVQEVFDSIGITRVGVISQQTLDIGTQTLTKTIDETKKLIGKPRQIRKK